MSYGRNILLITASAFALSVAAPALAQSGGSQDSPSASPSSPSTGAPTDDTNAVPDTGSTDSQGDTMNKSDNPVRGSKIKILNRADTAAPVPGGPAASLVMDWVAAQNTPAQKLVGAEVVNTENDTIGEVEEVVSLNGRNTLVVTVGAFLGIGGDNLVLDLEKATIFHHVNDMDNIRVLTGMTEEQLKAQPKFEPAGN